MLQNFTSIPLGLNGIFDLHFTTIKVSSCYVQIQNPMDGTQYKKLTQVIYGDLDRCNI